MGSKTEVALRALVRQDRKWATDQRSALARLQKAGAPTHAAYDQYHAQSLAWDLDLFVLARAAVDTWRPGDAPAGLLGARSYLVALARAVSEVEAVDPAGRFTELKERFAASVRQWRAVRASGASAAGYDSTFEQMSADADARAKVFSNLEAAVHDYAGHLEEQNVDSLLASFEELARTTAGVSGRITVEVVGPDGDVTVARDEVVDGPEPTAS